MRTPISQLFLVLLSGLLAERGALGGGLIVERVSSEQAAEVAGLQPGDRLLTWRPASAPAGEAIALQTPYDLNAPRQEEAPRHPVVLAGLRSGAPREWTLSSADWGLETRPDLVGEPLERFLAGAKARAAGEVEGVEREWRSGIAALRASEDGAVLAWLQERLAGALAELGRGEAADALFRETLAGVDRSHQPLRAAVLLQGWGSSLAARGLLEQAGARYREALDLARAAAPRSLFLAATLNLLGISEAKAGDHGGAERDLQESLAIRRELAPDSTEVTGSLNNLGILARRRGDIAGAEAYLARGLELLERIAPASLDRGLFALNLGNLEASRSNFERARELLRQALTVFERSQPDGENSINALFCLAEVANRCGALAEAEDYLRSALAVQNRRPLSPPERRDLLLELGNVQVRRGDLAGAEDQYRRALEIQEELEPDAIAAALALGSLGNLEAEQGNLAAARIHLERSLAIRERLEPGTRTVAVALENLGRLEGSSGGDLDRSEALLRRSLAVLETTEGSPLDISDLRLDLARVAERRGRPEQALEEARRALEVRRSRVPGSIDEAEALFAVGRFNLLLGREAEGRASHCSAIDVLDRQRGRLGGTATARASFEAAIGDYYSACIAALLRAAAEEEAFAVLERGRARSFLSLLAGRELRPDDLPPDLAAERRRLDDRYEAAQTQLRDLKAGPDDGTSERLSRELRDLESSSAGLAARIRQASPRSGALREPRPIDLAAARAALDPGTVLIEFAVEEERSWVFALQPAGATPGLVVRELGAGRKALEGEVEGYRRLLQDPASAPAALRARSRSLYRRLLRPVADSLRRARRLLVSPDGPLHAVPFAALLDGDRYLIERMPLHKVLSASVYAELRRDPPRAKSAAGTRVAAFGDPAYGDPASPARGRPAVGEALRRGLALTPLPGTRAEVNEIAAIFPGTSSYLGREATEERAKALGPETELVHFACHGYVDERFPLNSALALSLPAAAGAGEDDGLLQAWEIFERVRLRADLVTLSACDSGRGKEMGGEGLIGLVRAFQLAGARSVLASQWSVADRSTARLMGRFYTGLRAGRSKDEALRRAQLDLLRPRSAYSHPFHWAAFELFGDWR